MLAKLIVAFAMLAQLAADDPLAQYRADAVKRWEAEIVKLEQLDQQEQDPANAILFLGSSSIRRWESMATDLAPWPTIRRGYGGAKFSDLAVFVERLVKNHSCRGIAIFVGNDIVGGPQDKTPEEVLRIVNIIVKKIRLTHAHQPIFLIAVTPTSSRFHAWETIQQLNSRLASYCQEQESMHFVETAAPFLDPSTGKPRDELFVSDRLHLNSDGYQVWAKILREQFAEVLLAPTAE